MQYLLDTNICIHFLKGEYGIDKKVIEVGIENCYVSEITLLEILYGVENSDEARKAKNRESYNKFAHLFRQNIIPIENAMRFMQKKKPV